MALRSKWVSGNLVFYNASATGCLQIGQFHSTTQSSGLKLSQTRSANLRVYGDDGGAAMWAAGSVPDLRNSLSRMLVTYTQTGGHVRLHGAMGQLKAYDAAWNTEVGFASTGMLELVRSAATVTFGGYGISAAVGAVVCTSGAITVNTTHILAGVAAVSDFKATLTQTGKVAAFLVAAYDTTNWSDATARTTWGHAFLVKDIPSGTTGSILQAGVSATPLVMASAGNAVQLYINNSATSGTCRTVIAETSLTGATAPSLYTIRGYAEVGTGCTVDAGSYIAGVQGKLKVTGTMNHADSRLCAALVQLDITAGTYTAGQLSGLWVDCGASAASAHAGGGQFNILRLTNTTIAVPNAAIYVYAEATYLLDVGGPSGTPAWYGGAAGAGTVGANPVKIKILTPGGAKYFIAADNWS